MSVIFEKLMYSDSHNTIISQEYLAPIIQNSVPYHLRIRIGHNFSHVCVCFHAITFKLLEL